MHFRHMVTTGVVPFPGRGGDTGVNMGGTVLATGCWQWCAALLPILGGIVGLTKRHGPQLQLALPMALVFANHG